MRTMPGIGALAFALVWSLSGAEAATPLAAHRAAYNISLTSGEGQQAPVSASGLIAYEFRGARCSQYASVFRQATVLQKSEGDAVTADTKATSAEDGQGRWLHFHIDSTGSDSPSEPIDGKAARDDSGAIKVTLESPSPQNFTFDKATLFPTQHIQKIIDSARSGATSVQAQVFDGSDTGSKLYDTLTIIGKAGAGQAEDASGAEALKDLAHWPVTISYFDAAKKDSAAEYILSFNLYENGVSGSLKLDYGSFALNAHLVDFELLPATESCAN